MKKRSLPKIIFIFISIVIIVYVVFIKPNYYRFNGGKIYFETIYTHKFNVKDKADFYVHNNHIYISSVDGLKKETMSGETIWSKTYNMEEPLFLFQKDYMLVVNVTGKEVIIFNEKGFLTEFKVNYPIIMADINEKGFVAIVQENKQQHIIELYNEKGEILAKRVTRFEQDGYPIDVDISPNAFKMVTSYLFLGENALLTKLSFFDFTNKSNIEKITGGFSLEGTFAPEVEFIGDNKVVVGGDNTIKYYNNKRAPKLIKEISTNNEIKNIVYTNEQVVVQYGKQLSTNNSDKQTQGINIYNKDGKKVGHVKIGQDIKKIIGEGDSYYIITTAYIRKYKGSKKIWENSIKKEIEKIYEISKNKYLLIYNQGYDIVKVKSI
jgi:hypothetical protein